MHVNFYKVFITGSKMTAIAKSAKTHPSNRNFRLFKEFLPKFQEEKEFCLTLNRISAEISGKKGISAIPKLKSKIKFSVSVLQKPKHKS